MAGSKNPQYIHLVDKERTRLNAKGEKTYCRDYCYRVQFFSKGVPYRKSFSILKYGKEEAYKMAMMYLLSVIDKPQYNRNSQGNTKPLLFKKVYKPNKSSSHVTNCFVIEWYEGKQRKSKTFVLSKNSNDKSVLSEAKSFAENKSLELGYKGEFIKSKRKVNV